MPQQVIMAVNKYGVALLDAVGKDIVARWDYEEISMWSFGAEHFHLTIGGVLRSSAGLKLLCDTQEVRRMKVLYCVALPGHEWFLQIQDRILLVETADGQDVTRSENDAVNYPPPEQSRR